LLLGGVSASHIAQNTMLFSPKIAWPSLGTLIVHIHEQVGAELDCHVSVVH
jgi:hypothetical protein